MAEKITGLTVSEVERRIADGQVNRDSTAKTRSVGEILRSNLLTPFIALNAVLGAAILIFGSPKNALFLIVVVFNAAIGIFQELRAKRLVDRLSIVSMPKVTVIRDGIEKEIAVSGLVRDDVVMLRAGNQVCADSVVISGSAELDESLLTGESETVYKAEGSTLYSGSSVAAGFCCARVVGIGKENYAAKIAAHARRFKKPASEIMRSVNLIIKTVGFAIIPVGAALFIRQYSAGGGDLSQSVTSTVAALVGMIPEGLILLTSMVLAVGIIRLSRKNALVQELYSIEMLARVDVLCLDKTGTITEGRMQTEALMPVQDVSVDELRSAVAAVIYGTDEKNATAIALREYLAENGITQAPEAELAVPFSSARKWSGVTTAGGSFVLGAPAFVLGERAEEIKNLISAELEKGNRVLAVVSSAERLVENGLPADLKLLGFVVLSDVIRKSAPSMMKYFKEQGVAIKIISGDDPLTVSRIAAAAGVDGADRYVDATLLIPDEDGGAAQDESAEIRETFSQAIQKYAVFGRVTPGRKAELVRALKAAGHTVAMTGDGVNDVMALRESDCSIAPASGSDAARNVSQIVLMDSDFSSMTDIVAEGRRSINNLQRSASLFLTKTIFSTLLAVFFIFVKVGYPFQPIQLTLISGITIGIPSFVLALQPKHERIRGRFLTNVITKAVPGALTDVIIIAAATIVYLISGLVELTTAEISTVTTLVIASVGFMVLFRVCIPFNKIRTALFAALLMIFAGAILLFPEFFGIAVSPVVLLIAAMSVAAAALLYIGLVTLSSHVFSSSER